jgi:hypothetical protein
LKVLESFFSKIAGPAVPRKIGVVLEKHGTSISIFLNVVEI